MSTPEVEITLLLKRAEAGDNDARNQAIAALMPLLRERAAQRLDRERANHTLQPTALVNEAYLRLAEQRVEWQNREQFLALSSEAMRRILVDHARQRKAAKRGGHAKRIDLNDTIQLSNYNDDEIIDISDSIALYEEKFDPIGASIIVMRFFGNMTIEEMARYLGVSTSTVEKQWQRAKAWMNSRFLVE